MMRIREITSDGKVSVGWLIILSVLSCEGLVHGGTEETADQRKARLQRVEERRTTTHLICHRGACLFAHENTMEAYRATFELGADGNEIDIRATKDGVLVCFHDDMIDHLLKGYGDVADYTWEELRKIPFREPGKFREYCRIPTLREVCELHRDRAGLMFLDVKRTGLVPAVTLLLDEFDLWDHVIQAPPEYTDPRIRRTKIKGGLYLDRTEMDEAAIAALLPQPGERILIEYPQIAVKLLGRKSQEPTATPFHSEPSLWSRQPPRNDDPRSVEELLRVVSEAPDWNQPARGAEAEAASAERILARAKAADELARRQMKNAEVFAVLERRVRERTLHRNWRYCGLDGSAALRALVELRAPQVVELARFCVWRDDPAVATVQNPEYKNPRAWTDFRTKIPVFSLLRGIPGAETEKLCRDYLALSDEEAKRIGVTQFEEAARCLLTSSPEPGTIRELEQHRLSVVRGRAKLFELLTP